MHLVVHLEPEIKESVLSQSGIDKTNWRFILVYLIGILAYCSLLITFLIGSVKSLRRRFFSQASILGFFYHNHYLCSCSLRFLFFLFEIEIYKQFSIKL